ncbi:peptide MFS transporter [Litorimonas sp. WD9-15]|uniref:peptide MFS transporter n=1 Tax=Litorimonas sp. WD9-15 TaxID=3418716 RepID=UPI003D07E3AA
MAEPSVVTGPPPGEKQFFGHPRGLVICFLTEMWERYSYYGMRGLLLLYLVQHFLFTDGEANFIYGGYIALVYIMSMIGGVLSDKYLGQRKAVTFGAILLVAGHFGMAFEGSGSEETLSFNGGDYVIEDVGRDDRRQLFLDYEGETRRLVFDSTQFAQMEDDRYSPIGDDGQGDYIIERQRRGLVQNICGLVGLGCAGAENSTTLVLNGTRFEVTSETANADKEPVLTLADGRTLTEKSETDILVLATATTDKVPDLSNVIATAADGNYSTSIEKQALYVNILFFSLALIIAGVGFLKPNISTIVGDLYPKGDPRRDGGFTLFYMGINLGSFLATWTCGILGILYGWAWGFGLAGVGMLLGLLVFHFGQKWLDGVANPPSVAKLKEKAFGPVNIEWACYLSAVGIVVLCMGLLKHAEVIGPIAATFGVLVFIGFIVMSFTQLQGKARKRMWAALYFAVAQIPFWSLFEQAGSSLTLVTSRLVDTTIFGWDVPTPVFQSLNAGFIFIFAPFIAMMWVGLAKRKWEPSTPVKFALGVFGAGLGYLVLVAGMSSVGPAALTPVFFIFAIYWVHTMAELMLSPVGLSAMTKLAPARMVGLFMAAWFVYSGLGNALSGVIAAAAGAETVGGQIVDVAGAKKNYIQVFSSIGYIGMGIGFVMLLIAPIIRRWMEEDDADVVMVEDTLEGKV